MPDVGDLHPGVKIALARGKMDEAQLARAMAAGEITSPQHFGNAWLFALRITGTGGAYRQSLDEYVWRDPGLYLNQGFLDRCSGLPVIVEHPDKQMLDTEEYDKRNIGSIVYPYIRPEAEEVWGIARILDMPAAKFMRTHQLSTSPAVVFRPSDDNEKIKVGDGKHLLIEGKPSLLDHLAICDEGVWDKGGPPTGVDLTGVEESTMADEDKKEEVKEEEKKETEADRKDARARDDDAARKDEEKIDRLLEGIKTLADRMDSIEGGRKDASAEEEAAQAAELHRIAGEEEEEAKEAAVEGDSKKDAKKDEDELEMDRKDAKKRDDDEEDDMPWEEAERKEAEKDSAYSKRVDSLGKKHGRSDVCKRDDESVAAHCDRMDRMARKDRARKDSARRLGKVDAIADAVTKLAGRVDALTRRSADRTEDDEVKFADAQARADDVYMSFGDHAPRPLSGEQLVGYRLRLARNLQKHSAVWKDSDLGAIARTDPSAFSNIEKLIYADASKAAHEPQGIQPGMLREIKKRLPGGHEVSTFVGDPLSWMSTFMTPGRSCTRISQRPRT